MFLQFRSPTKRHPRGRLPEWDWRLPRELGDEYMDIRKGQFCFLWIAISHATGACELDEYLDRLLKHLTQTKPLHKFDTRGQNQTALTALTAVDIVAASVKAWMLDEEYKPLTDDSLKQLKDLCVLVWSSDNSATLQTRSDISTLPSRAIDLLASIAYSRRHLATLTSLISYSPIKKTTFDLFHEAVLFFRSNNTNNEEIIEHPWALRTFRATVGTELEIRTWTSLLKRGWIHAPFGDNIISGLNWLVRRWEFRTSALLGDFFEAFQEQHIKLDLTLIRAFLTGDPDPSMKPYCTAEQALLLRSYDLLPDVFDSNTSAVLLSPLAHWDKDDNDRLIVLRMLLEKGADPSGKPEQWESRDTNHDAQQQDTPLHMAAERGDVEMVNLFLQFGGLNSVRDGRKKTAAERARAKGFEDLAKMLDTSAPSSEKKPSAAKKSRAAKKASDVKKPSAAKKPSAVKKSRVAKRSSTVKTPSSGQKSSYVRRSSRIGAS